MVKPQIRSLRKQRQSLWKVKRRCWSLQALIKDYVVVSMDIAIIGEKCKAQIGRSNAKNVVLSFAGVGRDIPTFADAQAIADQLTMLPTDYASIKILYNKFINATSYEPTRIEAYSEESIANSANFAAFEIDDEVLSNMREFALANSLYWALAEGHACEQSARRNAMDVSI
jgi:F-type H+-transporting ATPase subunit gamma